MGDLLTSTFLSSLIAGAILAGMPLVLGALGETVSERAGVLNIGLEGMMLVGGYAGFVAALYSDSHWLGLITGMMAGMVLSVVMVLFCVHWGLDQIVVGIAILLTAEGLTSVLHTAQFGTTYPRLDATHEVAVPVLSRIPVLGTSLFTQPLVVYFALGLAAVIWWVLGSTHIGLNLRAAGEKPAALDAAGVSVLATRSGAVLFTGAMAGLGGAYLSIIAAGIFVPFMTNGAGFISIVIAMLGRGRPGWVLVGAFLFGASVSLTTALQLVGISVPIDLVNMLPFVVVMIALVIFARQAYLPASLATPYVRGAR